MIVGWRFAHKSLSPFVLGYVERADIGDTGASIELPFAIPVIHITLSDGAPPAVTLLNGSGIARIAPPRSAQHVFVIALGFSGVARLSPALKPAGQDCITAIEDPFWSSLAERTGEAPDFQARAGLVEQQLLERVAGADRASSTLFKAADAIVQDRWYGPIRDLALRYDVEERTLRNRFRRDLGCSPKRLLRIARFNRALRALHPRPWGGRAAADVRLEFFDDAHFYREFRAHAGISPAAFVAAKRRSGDSLLHSVLLDSI